MLADVQGHSRLGYKDPADIINLSRIAELLPTARFVQIIRDGRDVARSFLKFDWGPTNVFAGSRYWARRVEQALGLGRGQIAGVGDASVAIAT